MKLACVRQIADLAKADISEEVANAYAGKELVFGSDYLIPTPFDSRLILRIAPAVAQAAFESGVAARPIQDMEAYRQQLSRFVYQTGMFMRPVFSAAKAVLPAANIQFFVRNSVLFSHSLCLRVLGCRRVLLMQAQRRKKYRSNARWLARQ